MDNIISGERPSLLLVDDDATFREVLSLALKKRGFEVTTAADVTEAIAMAELNPPEYAVVDLKMPSQSGLVLIRRLKELDDSTRIVLLTGYASITTAVEAIKLGATHYLAKPADADEIVAALNRIDGDESATLPKVPLTIESLEWDHIQRVLSEHNGNITTTAEVLRLHRRTLQRKIRRHQKNSDGELLP